MLKKGRTARYREKLDKTLASDDLTDRRRLTKLVKEQLLRSSEHANEGYIDNVLARRTDELSNMLEMLKSASDSHETLPNAVPRASWKLKQDNEEFRVMYREGPEGSPFHTLLVEGYVDAPLYASLCISWETELYPTWFPEIRIPTFKVICAKHLQKIRIGEQISLLRTKLSWPLSNREVLLHYSEFEYFDGNLVVVMVNTIDDVESVKLETHGFTNDEIPEAGEMVRVDLVGGFALQKVSEHTTYFRTIANMDVKLDFVPPSLINFVSRQLIGSAFKLYKKSVLSISRDDSSFWKPLDDTLYSRITEALYSHHQPDKHAETGSVRGEKYTEDDNERVLQHDVEKAQKTVNENRAYTSCSPQYDPSINQKTSSNIENEGNKECEIVEEDSGSRNHETEGECSKPTAVIPDVRGGRETFCVGKKLQVSPPVEQAIETLEQVISLLKERKKSQHASQTDVANEVYEKMEAIETKHSAVEDHGNVIGSDSSTRGSRGQSSAEETAEKSLQESHETRPEGSSSYLSIVNLQETTRESPESNVSGAGAIHQVTSPFVENGLIETPSSSANYNTPTPDNGIHEKRLTGKNKSGEQKKWRFCCLRIISGRLVSS